jgi:cytoskeleton protein RodZ
MHTIGSILKEMRMSRGIEIGDIARKTRISVHFLKDLEEGRFNRIPRVFDRGYLKIYANFLNLDAKPLLARYEQEKQESLRSD